MKTKPKLFIYLALAVMWSYEVVVHADPIGRMIHYAGSLVCIGSVVVMALEIHFESEES